MAGRPWWQILLAIYLILIGLLALTNLSFQFAPIILAILAIVAGIALLFQK